MESMAFITSWGYFFWGGYSIFNHICAFPLSRQYSSLLVGTPLDVWWVCFKATSIASWKLKWIGKERPNAESMYHELSNSAGAWSMTSFSHIPDWHKAMTTDEAPPQTNKICMFGLVLKYGHLFQLVLRYSSQKTTGLRRLELVELSFLYWLVPRS